MQNKIACVVPTVRPDCWDVFINGWKELFEKHNVALIKVQDGEVPLLTHNEKEYKIEDIMKNDGDLIFNKNDGVRNLGFAYITKYLPEVETIITLDDDTLPEGDTIQAHLDALNKRFPLEWMSTASEYVRGVPYWIRDQCECTVSHGVWKGVMDWDAPTQLVNGNHQLAFFKGNIPKGVYFPFCGMNIAFKRKMLPYMYYAPMGYKVGMDRFADIWLGIWLRRICDHENWAIATGYAYVNHDRASNVWANLKKEIKGLEINEHYYEWSETDDYFKLYNNCRKRWKEWTMQLL
jgi:reversibly glycosylated polypeptide/UDP-arabinopyranose mutase